MRYLVTGVANREGFDLRIASACATPPDAPGPARLYPNLVRAPRRPRAPREPPHEGGTTSPRPATTAHPQLNLSRRVALATARKPRCTSYLPPTSISSRHRRHRRPSVADTAQMHICSGLG